ncbi:MULTISPECIES: hypothetical protein [unclassified Pseudomonas]|uniref:hypothetical protein n=1 Tax=unclassified Pseudomonas TaxID=196821 RepID=UPI00087172C4|nr:MULTISPECIES: hypothetical protein [unclassified Pseudomonas]SCW95934.1 hypothetical protein SAMN03159481_04106 [Pseudomonas sp. NFACC56-3]SFL05546.1 hypothetical protein SAMN03159473_05514 [Pseudomonas sp. NFACC52]
MDVHSPDIAEELEDEGSDLVFPEPESRSLAASAHLLDSGRDQPYQVTYRLATDQQIKGLFRRKRPEGDLLQPSNFLGRPCYELWTKGSLAGVAVLGFSGMEFSDEIYLTVTLDAVYLANSSRGTGLVYSFLEDVAKAAYLVSMAPLAGPGRELPKKLVNLTITAELHSDGGQSAVRALGDSLSWMFSLSGFPSLKIVVEDSNF